MRVGASRIVCLKIKDYLNDKGITQSSVCRKTGISSWKISEALNAKQPLRLDEYLMICDALGEDPKRFL